MEEKKVIPRLGAYDHVSMALWELCEVMDDTQSMYHHLFVQTLHIKKSFAYRYEPTATTRPIRPRVEKNLIVSGLHMSNTMGIHYVQ